MASPTELGSASRSAPSGDQARSRTGPGAGASSAIVAPSATVVATVLGTLAAIGLTKADFRGKAVVLFFGYTHCPDVCPLHMANIAAVRTVSPPAPDTKSAYLAIVATAGERCFIARGLNFTANDAGKLIREVIEAQERLVDRLQRVAASLESGELSSEALLRAARLVADVYEHTMPVPAEAWGGWAQSEDFLRVLRARLGRLGANGRALTKEKSAAEIARLDAAARMTQRDQEGDEIQRRAEIEIHAEPQIAGRQACHLRQKRIAANRPEHARERERERGAAHQAERQSADKSRSKHAHPPLAYACT